MPKSAVFGLKSRILPVFVLLRSLLVSVRMPFSTRAVHLFLGGVQRCSPYKPDTPAFRSLYSKKAGKWPVFWNRDPHPRPGKVFPDNR